MGSLTGQKMKRVGLWLTLGIVAPALAGALSWGLSERVSAQESTPPPAAREKFTELAIVDFDKLLQDRPGYERVRQLDEQIALLKRELEFLPAQERKRKVDSGRKRMEREVEKARNELQAEYERVSQEMANFQKNLASQLESEGRKISAQYQSVLQKKIAALAPAQPQVPQSIQERMDSFLADLAGVRQQRLAAKRLELESAMQNKLDAERARIDEELAAFDTVLMRENQEERVNLQLQLQTASNAEEEAAIQEKLAALGEKEAERKTAKRDELSKAYDAELAAQQANIEAELKKYERTLDAETREKAQAERNRLLKGVELPDVASNQAAVKAQIEKTRAAVNAEMEAKKAEMTATMQAKADEAQKRMQRKQADVESRLRKVQKQLELMVARGTEDVSQETRQKMDDLQAKIDDLQKQRDGLYESMASELRQLVAQIAAKQEGQPAVIGSYFANIDCLDLTDKTMIALGEEDQP